VGTPVAAQNAVCENCGYYTEPVEAKPGGPYVGMTGQSIQLYGWQSWSMEGWIVGYYWSFGDGTWGSGPNPTHQYAADGVYSVSLTVCDENWNCASSESSVTVDSVNLPVKLTFDELPNNTVVADQYFNQYGVRFYTANPFYPVHTQQNCGFCSTTSLPNFVSTIPDLTGQLIVEFAQPVSNLTFYIIGLDSFFNPFAVVDVYRNGSFYGSYTIYGNGTYTVGFTGGALDHISKIVVRNITDPAGVGFDDLPSAYRPT
jgi:PKD repeat protein